MHSNRFVTRYDLSEEAQSQLADLESRVDAIWIELRDNEDKKLYLEESIGWLHGVLQSGCLSANVVGYALNSYSSEIAETCSRIIKLNEQGCWTNQCRDEIDVSRLGNIVECLYDVFESGYLTRAIVHFVLTSGDVRIFEIAGKIIELNKQGLWIEKYQNGIDRCKNDFIGIADAMLILQAAGQLNDDTFNKFVGHPKVTNAANFLYYLSEADLVVRENIDNFFSIDYQWFYRDEYTVEWMGPLESVMLTQNALDKMKEILGLELDNLVKAQGIGAYFNFFRFPCFKSAEPTPYMMSLPNDFLYRCDNIGRSLNKSYALRRKINNSFPSAVVNGEVFVDEFRQIKQTILKLDRFIEMSGDRFQSKKHIDHLKELMVYDFRSAMEVVYRLDKIGYRLAYSNNGVVNAFMKGLQQYDHTYYQARVSGLVRSYVNLYFKLLLSVDSVSHLLKLTNHYARLQSQGLRGFWGRVIVNVITSEFGPLVGYTDAVARVKVENDALQVALDDVPKEQRVVAESTGYQQYCRGIMRPRLLALSGWQERARAEEQEIKLFTLSKQKKRRKQVRDDNDIGERMMLD